jgi:hypothetical protein
MIDYHKAIKKKLKNATSGKEGDTCEDYEESERA